MASRTLVEAVDELDRDDQGLTFVENGEEKFLGFASLNQRSRELGEKCGGSSLGTSRRGGRP